MIMIRLIASSAVVYAGIKLYGVAKKNPSLGSILSSHQSTIYKDSTDETEIIDLEDSELLQIETWIDRELGVAFASLGCITAGSLFFAPLTILGVGGLIYLAFTLWKEAYRDLFEERRLTYIVLEAIMLPGTLLAGTFFAAALGYCLFYLALKMVANIKGGTTKNLTDVFVTPAHRVVWIMRDGIETETILKDVQVGDIIVVEAGETAPVDGQVVEGMAAVDQRQLTGESQLSEKGVGDSIFATTMLLTGRILIEVEKTGEETIAGQVSQVLDEMTNFTATLELRSVKLADQCAWPYLLMGGAAAMLRGISSGLAILWFPLDDAIYVAGPLSVMNYLNIALRKGILVKDGRALEQLRQVDTIVFDKTGTLTQEQPIVSKIYMCSNLTEDDILRYAAAVEHKQTHPIALAILEEAQSRSLNIPSICDMVYAVGYGLQGTIENRTVRVGSDRFMVQNGIPFPSSLADLKTESAEAGYSLVYLAINEVIAGAIQLQPTLRPDTAETVAKLKARGYELYIISGDHETPTRHLANQLGIDNYFAETLPEDKANLIEQLQQQGKVVCYMGDGINDAIALKQAEVSISLRGASTIATDTAQVILTNESLDQLIELIDLAYELDANFKSTVIASALPSIAIVGGVFIFHISLSAAIACYMLGMGLSIGNALRPLLQRRGSWLSLKNHLTITNS